jgi:hypothetical protein
MRFFSCLKIGLRLMTKSIGFVSSYPFSMSQPILLIALCLRIYLLHTYERDDLILMNEKPAEQEETWENYFCVEGKSSFSFCLLKEKKIKISNPAGFFFMILKNHHTSLMFIIFLKIIHWSKNKKNSLGSLKTSSHQIALKKTWSSFTHLMRKTRSLHLHGDKKKISK